jgi:membrane protease YdiL (CAAX protease family)
VSLKSLKKRTHSPFAPKDVMHGVNGELAATLRPGLIALGIVWLCSVALYVAVYLLTDGGLFSFTATLSLLALFNWAEISALTWVVGRKLSLALLAVRPWLTPYTPLAVIAALAGLLVAGFIPEPFMPQPAGEAQATALKTPIEWFDAITASVIWFAVGCVVVPIVEEVLFRGWLQPALVDAGWSVPVAIVFTSVVFGVLHPWVFTATFYGLLFGLLRERTGRLSAPIVAHAAVNTAIGLMVFLEGGPAEMLYLV